MNTNPQIIPLQPNTPAAVAPPAAPTRFQFPALEPWPEPIDGARLLDDLAAQFRRFLVLPQWAPETLALWDLHTYAFHLRDLTAYIAIESPEKRCGKTTLLTLLSQLVYRPMVAANISPPALFRVIEELCPTLLIDEADTFLHANQELRGILNAGYKRQTAFVLRAIQPSGQEPPPASSATLQRSSASTLQRFSCWCPKILATIGRFPDVLADRCIVIRMQRKTAKEACDRLRNLDPTPLCRQAARFVADHASAISAAHPDVPAALNDRAAEIWEPLFALADLAGGHWPDLARQAALALTATAQDHNPIGSLLLDIYLLFLEGRTDRLFSRSLAAGLNCLPERPWAELRNGKPITELFLSQQLRPYGVKPRTLRLGDLQAKGYLLEELTEIFHRYIPKSELENLLADSLPPTPIAPQQ